MNDRDIPILPIVEPRFVIEVSADTAVGINDTVFLWARPAEGSIPVWRYVWSLVGGPEAGDTTVDDTKPFIWGRDDTGMHKVVIEGLTAGGMASEPETLTVQVSLMPPSLLPMLRRISVSICDTLYLRASAVDENGPLVYHWQVDTGEWDSADADSLPVVWCSPNDTGDHIVRVFAKDEDSLRTQVDSTIVTVLANPPTVGILGDTTVWVFDTATFAARGVDSGGSVSRYIWSVGTREFGDTTLTGALDVVFGIGDTGKQRVWVVCEDDDSVRSEPDSMEVVVRIGAPSVRLMNDTTVWAGDSLVFRAAAFDTNGTIVDYSWQVGEGAPLERTTAESLVVWPELVDTGRLTITVGVRDDDGIRSLPDTMTVTVRSGLPTVSAPPDTLVMIEDTLSITVAANDPNGTIRKVYWRSASGSWIDSSDEFTYRLWYRGADPEIVVVGVRDDDGLVSFDTTVVFFSSPSQTIAVIDPVDTAYLAMHDSTFFFGTVPYRVGCLDVHGVCNLAEHVLYQGREPATLSVAHRGSETSFVLTGLDTAVYYRLLTGKDRWGGMYAYEDTYVVALAHDICFAGHSIVAGMKDEELRGGFRSVVLDSLRRKRTGLNAVRSVGPVRTPFWPGAADDGCLAKSGATSRDIYDSLSVHPELSADTWVVMVGVNGDYYNYWEHYYTRVLLEAIYRRNPRASIFVLNGLPLPDDALPERHLRLKQFNDMLVLLEEEWQAGGRSLFLVDAHAAFTPDSIYHPAYLADHLHPNRLGYDVLGREIIKVMNTQ